MNWIKKGVIYQPEASLSWSQTHAQVPTPYFDKEANQIIVYFSTRDDKSRSQLGSITLDADNPKQIISLSEQPLLELGKVGTFDDCGVMPSWIVERANGELWLYYIGWNVRNTIPYHNSVGLAISKDKGKNFTRFSEGPLFGRTHLEPYFTGSSCVLRDNGIWKNWYLSCTDWREVNGKQEPRYHIKYAESKDGIDWERKGIVAIDYEDEAEAGIVKASVIIEDGLYKMWYAYRNILNYRTNLGSSYRIGYAESKDGIEWTRKDDEAGIDVSSDDWDSFMVTYPHVIDIKGKRLMFYNGNGFGSSGFGYAELELNK
jgi:predicted GH43/DUF377 family glycosyl hydrolase